MIWSTFSKDQLTGVNLNLLNDLPGRYRKKVQIGKLKKGPAYITRVANSPRRPRHRWRACRSTENRSVESQGPAIRLPATPR